MLIFISVQVKAENEVYLKLIKKMINCSLTLWWSFIFNLLKEFFRNFLNQLCWISKQTHFASSI